MKTTFVTPERLVCNAEPAARLSPGRLWARFRLRQQTRRALLRMSDEQLKDVGLTRQQAEREARLPVWQLLR